MTRSAATSPNFADCLTVGEAAEYLGVSTATLRNWDRSGKLKPRRHPQNAYRIYLHEDLEAVLRSADLSALADESFALQVDWSKLRGDEHVVQFYEDAEFLIESGSGFVGAALRAGGSSVVALTREHCRALNEKLVASGINVAELEELGRYVALDARETLTRFMTGRSIDRNRFDEFAGGIIGGPEKKNLRLHAFGEMAPLLWADGNREAAIELEQLSHELAIRHGFAILCAYPIADFIGDRPDDGMQDVCSCHSRVLPAESYSAADTEDKRLRAIAFLQQKARSLEAEIKHRAQVENALYSRERELSDYFEHATQGFQKVDADAEHGNEIESRLRILVVDDNLDSGRTMSLLLKLKGHDVRMAADGLEAIAVAEEFRPHVILMDVAMPKLNGYEATQRLRETDFGRDILIVALTGWGQASDVARSIEAGCSAHLVKPVDFAELERVLAKAK